MTETEVTLQINRIEQQVKELREQQAVHPCDIPFFHYCQSQIDWIESELDMLREQEGAISWKKRKFLKTSCSTSG